MSEAIFERTCQRCGKKWWPCEPGRPFKCPRCQSTAYDRPYKRKPTKAESVAQWKAERAAANVPEPADTTEPKSKSRAKRQAA